MSICLQFLSVCGLILVVDHQKSVNFYSLIGNFWGKRAFKYPPPRRFFAFVKLLRRRRYFMIVNYALPSCSVKSFVLVDAGEERAPTLHFSTLRQRFHYIIHFVYKGSGVFQTRSLRARTENKLTEGSIFAIYKDDAVLYNADANDPFHYFWFSFDGDESEKLMEYIGFSPKRPVLHLKNADEVFKTFKRLFGVFKKDDNYASLCATLQCIETLRNNVEDSDLPLLSENENELFTRAESYIRENIHTNIKVNDLISHLNIDRSYFSKIFKKRFGLSPQTYIRSLKLRNAEYMLRSTNYSITAIAEAIGFTDVYCFSKLFKKQYGYSPSQFRKRKQQKNDDNKR